MVTAVIKDKSIEIHTMEDLAGAIDSSRRANEPLVLVVESGERIEFPSGAADLSPDERRAKLLETAGSWKGLVDGEELKRMIYASRGQTGRDWDFPWHADVEE